MIFYAIHWDYFAVMSTIISSTHFPTKRLYRKPNRTLIIWKVSSKFTGLKKRVQVNAEATPSLLKDLGLNNVIQKKTYRLNNAKKLCTVCNKNNIVPREQWSYSRLQDERNYVYLTCGDGILPDSGQMSKVVP